MILEIPLRTPSLNAWNNKPQWQWQKVRRLWAFECKLAMLKAKVFGRPEFKGATLTIERHAHRPIGDQDNLVGGLKPVLDGLVTAGLLSDDSRDSVTYTIQQIRSTKEAERTLIHVTLFEDV